MSVIMLKMLAIWSLTILVDLQTHIFLFGILISLLIAHSVDCFNLEYN